MSITTPDILLKLTQTIAQRQAATGEATSSSYVAKLFQRAPDSFLKKIAEESGELIMACKDADAGMDKSRVVAETADLWFHSLIALAHYGLSAQDVLAELARREGIGGLVEKASRTTSEP